MSKSNQNQRFDLADERKFKVETKMVTNLSGHDNNKNDSKHNYAST